VFFTLSNHDLKTMVGSQFGIHLRNPGLNWSILACRHQPGLTMLTSNRREFLRGTAATTLALAAPADLLAQAANSSAPVSGWDAGAVRHLLPTVSDTRMLIKMSFNAPLSEPPTLRVGSTSMHGRMGDTRGEHWHFYATDLKPGPPHRLTLTGAKSQRRYS
jgi:hypothetical protein